MKIFITFSLLVGMCCSPISSKEILDKKLLESTEWIDESGDCTYSMSFKGDVATTKLGFCWNSSFVIKGNIKIENNKLLLSNLKETSGQDLEGDSFGFIDTLNNKNCYLKKSDIKYKYLYSLICDKYKFHSKNLNIPKGESVQFGKFEIESIGVKSFKTKKELNVRKEPSESSEIISVRTAIDDGEGIETIPTGTMIKVFGKTKIKNKNKEEIWYISDVLLESGVWIKEEFLTGIE